MQYRTLGKTGLSVSEIGYGGGRVRPEHDQAALVKMLHYAMDCGLNYFDTAPDYGGGYSETVIGKAIAGRRESCIVATKTEEYDPEGIATDVEGQPTTARHGLHRCSAVSRWLVLCRRC